MTSPKPEVTERHRRMARDFRFSTGYAEDRLRLWFEHGFTGPLTKFECETLPIEAQLIATVEHDAFARGVEAEQKTTLVAASNFGIDLNCGSCASRFYTGFTGYQHEPSCKTNDALAHRTTALLPEPPRGEACTCELNDLDCPVHGTKGGEK